jgi:hypothetical protein
VDELFSQIPNYSSFNRRELEREWIKYDVLIEKLQESGLSIESPDPNRENIEKVFVRYHTAVYRMKKEHFIEDEITNIRMWMIVIWLIIDLIANFILKINLTGYFAFQMSMMKRYDQLLYILGEKKWVESNRTGIGSPMFRIVFISCFSSIIFLLLRMVMSSLSTESCTTLTNTVLNIFLGNPSTENGASGMRVFTEMVTNATAGNFDNFLGGLSTLLGQ